MHEARERQRRLVQRAEGGQLASPWYAEANAAFSTFLTTLRTLLRPAGIGWGTAGRQG